MNKPNNYAETPDGSFTPIELGGHIAIIKQVEETESKNGDPMIVVSLDFDKADKQAGYFADQFKKDIRPEKKWPNQATQYILTEYNGKCTSNFKKFITSFASSNGIDPEKGIKWGNDFAAQFKNKKIGVVFGKVEEEYNGEVKKRTRLRWFCDANKALEQTTPEEKLLKQDTKPAPKTDTEGFMSVPTGSDDEELPFD